MRLSKLRNKKKFANFMDAGTTVSGDIHAEDSWKIAGLLTGNLTVMDDILIEKTAEIRGDLSGENIWVAGKIVGSVVARENLYLHTSCHIEGDITYQSLVIEDGAHFNGMSHTDLVSSAEVAATSGVPSEEEPNDKQGIATLELEVAKEASLTLETTNNERTVREEQYTIRSPIEQPTSTTQNKRIVIR